MTPTSIDAEQLIAALLFKNSRAGYCLDRQTGALLLVNDPTAARAMAEAGPQRYLPVSPIPIYDAWQIMNNFMITLPESDLRQELGRALLSSSPFRAFEKALLHHPPIQQLWRLFHREAMLEFAREWLAGEGVECVLKLPPEEE